MAKKRWHRDRLNSCGCLICRICRFLIYSLYLTVPWLLIRQQLASRLLLSVYRCSANLNTMDLEQDEIERRSRSISMQKAVVVSYTFSWQYTVYRNKLPPFLISAAFSWRLVTPIALSADIITWSPWETNITKSVSADHHEISACNYITFLCQTQSPQFFQIISGRHIFVFVYSVEIIGKI